MRNFVKSFLLAASALLLLASCSNLETNASVDALENEGKAFLTFSIGGVDDSAARSAARTINPTAYTEDNESAFKIKLEAVSESLETVTVEDISKNAAGAAVSTYTVELTYDVWYITLSALDGDNVVMQARKRFDLTKGIPSAEDAMFTLSSKGVTTPGAVNLTAKYKDGNTTAGNFATVVKAIECGLYTFERNEFVEGTSSTITTFTALHKLDALNQPTDELSGEYKFSYAPKDADDNLVKMAPGRYMFRARFYDDTDVTKRKVIGTYGDVIVIAPGRTTAPTSTIDCGDLLFKKPAAPTNLSAYLVNGSQHKVNDDEGYYDVLIKWTDASDNEEHFVLTITDEDGATPVTYKVFGAEKNVSDKKEIFIESDMWVSGNLNAGSTSCVVRFPTGKSFDISLKAENFMGDSPVCTRKTTDIAAEADHTAFESEKINSGMITYRLNGGTYKNDADSENVIGEYVEFPRFGTSDAVTFITPDNSGAGYPRLTNGHHPFSGWKVSAETNATSATVPDTCENLVVYAHYNGDVALSWTFALDTYGDIETTALVVPSANSNDNAGESCKNAVVTVTGNNGDGNRVVRIKATNITEADVVEMKIELNGESAGISSVAGKNVITFPVSKLRTGNNNVIVLVKKNDGNWYGDAFNITKKN